MFWKKIEFREDYRIFKLFERKYENIVLKGEETLTEYEMCIALLA